MNLIKIKHTAEKKSYLLKDLSEKIGMSYQNLNRCIRENKISANDLEKISEVLEVPISYFFEDDIKALTRETSIGNTNINCEKLQIQYNAALKEIEYLQKQIKDKEEIINLLKRK
ncbi:MAG: helix-turn-helix transcriptional regulator [Bacteroidales bacterium]|nr:helix-turn-helix transcriptional regulator [Bacteroidales bacterium]